MELKKIWAPLLLLLSSCTLNQEKKVSEILSPITYSHKIKIVRESLDHPSSLFSLCLIPFHETYIFKTKNLPLNEHFLFASFDGISGKMSLLYELETLSDGSLKVFDTHKRCYVDSLSFQVKEKEVLYGKQIEYFLVRKKDSSSAQVSFNPYPLSFKGTGKEVLSLTVVHPMLTRFHLNGKGFEPHETLQMTHRLDDRVEKREITTDAEGNLEIFLQPLVVGQLGGEAHLSFTGKNGTIEFKYPWGGQLENQTYAEHPLFSMALVYEPIWDCNPDHHPLLSVTK